jgi:hypothetical protein
MYALLRFAIAATAMAGLAACAGTQHRATAAAPVEHVRTGTYQGDPEYVAAVEHVARRRGVQVHWVNPPVRRVSPPNQ